MLSSDFIYQYKDKPTPFANYGLGEFVYKRTYSRLKDDGLYEEWYETIERVVNGAYKILLRHLDKNNIKYNLDELKKEAEKLYDLLFNIKFLPGGRSLWAMGTKITDEKGLYTALNNCAFVSTKNENKTRPYEFLFDAAMLGVGVGFDTKGTDTKIYKPLDETYIYVIEDTREGWVKALKELLLCYFEENHKKVIFDYSQIRPEGLPLKTFGGTSSGYKPLKLAFDSISEMLDNNLLYGTNKPNIINDIKDGKITDYKPKDKLNSIMILDIMNMLCKCVVSGNVRRSATIAGGEYNDIDFMDAKDWKKHPERQSYCWLSNNSVIGKIGMDYSEIAKRVKRGEPGIFWLENAQKYSRMNGIADYKDKDVAFCNPCGEQTLHNFELCNLTEIFINRQNNYEDFINTLTYAYKYAKIVSLCDTQWEETNKVIEQNRRLGISLTGIVNFIQDKGLDQLRQYTTKGYEYVRNLDKEYSKFLNINESIKLTTVKPSGTVSLLAPFTCPGIHYPISRYYIRRVRVNNQQTRLINSMKSKGYLVENAPENEPNTIIINFPIDIKYDREESKVSLWEKLELSAKLNEWWSDNAVSCTIYYNIEKEDKDIKYALEMYQYRLKGITFLGNDGKIYPKMPYEKITKAEYDLMIKNINNKKIEIDTNDQVEEMFCTTDTCILKSFKKDKNTKIIFMNGLAGSGKSYLADKISKYIKSLKLTCKILSKDDFRYVDGNYIFNREYEKIVEEKYFNKLYELLNDNLNYIILDNTHIGNDFVEKTLEKLKGYKTFMLCIEPFENLDKHIEQNTHIRKEDIDRIKIQYNNWKLNYPLYNLNKKIYKHNNNNNFDNIEIQNIINDVLKQF